MRDVSAELTSMGDEPFRRDEHERFVDHLAGWCAATWGFRDEPATGPGLLPYSLRWGWFGHAALEGERALGWPERVPAIAAEGWARFAQRAPVVVAAAVEELRRDVTPLADALRATPSCLLHGDPKASNMGTAPDGRTVLIDWAYVGGPRLPRTGVVPGPQPAKLPVSKEDTIDSFRTALGRHGVATAGWWDRQLALALLGTVVQFSWEKALGDGDELAWWCDAAREGLRRL